MKENPKRPPKRWMRGCIRGVKKSGSAQDPGAVCGSLWYQKMSEAHRRQIVRAERAGRLEENALADNQGTGGLLLLLAALGVGAIVLVSASKSASAAPAAVPPAPQPPTTPPPTTQPPPSGVACTFDQGRVHTWAMGKGMLGFYFPTWNVANPPTADQILGFIFPQTWPTSPTSGAIVGVVVVDVNGNFWHYPTEFNLPTKRDDFYADYCATFGSKGATQGAPAFHPGDVFMV